MLRHKLIDRVCCVILALTLLVSVLFVGAAATGRITEDTTIGYEKRLFDQSRVHTIDIVMDDWEAFLKTATSEVYAACHLVIDGERYKNVGIRGKGNTSLSSVAAYGNNRYSFKVEFDQYQTGLTYHGLDKLSLNNLIQDNTYMKDYFAYTLMNKMGVAAPLCSFVQVSVNGEPWGLYLAVEGVEDAFLQRNYGKNHGELYKPDSLSFGGGRGNGRDFDMGDIDFSFGGEEESADNTGMPQAPGGDDGFGGSAGGSSGDSAGGSAGGPAATSTPAVTATPEPTATPAPTAAPAGDSFGGSAGDTASAGDAASGGMPADGTMPEMGNPPENFDPNQIPGSSGEMAAMPAPAAEASITPVMPEGVMPADGTAPVMPDRGNPPADFDPRQMEGFEMPDMGGFGGFGSSTDVKLQYADDNPSSYANIFNNAKTDITAADQTRLIASLKALGEGDTSVVNTDAVIRYMAVHNFLCNDDSYTGMMVHNYYLYEENGVLEMIPWDYNLAYGGFSGGNATSTVNTTISRLVSMGNDSDRPMAGWITASEEYMAQYLDMYREFMATAFDSGWFAAEIDRVQAMIDPYVQADPTAFCSYEEFLTGAETLKAFCLKRAQSVTHQLNGSNAQVDASELNLSVMGTMNNGGGFGGGPGGDFGGRGDRRGQERAPDAAEPTQQAPQDAPADDAASSGGQSVGEAASTPETTVMPEQTPEAGAEKTERPAFDNAFGVERSARRNNGEAWHWIIACVIILAAALVLTKCCRTNR